MQENLARLWHRIDETWRELLWIKGSQQAQRLTRDKAAKQTLALHFSSLS